MVIFKWLIEDRLANAAKLCSLGASVRSYRNVLVPDIPMGSPKV